MFIQSIINFRFYISDFSIRYAVYLVNSSIEDHWSYILGMNRVCVNAKKLMLIAIVNSRCEGEFNYVEMKRWTPESNRE